MKRLIVFLPLLAALGIGAAVLWGLDPERDPNGIPSVLIGQPVPEFDLPAVAGIDTGAGGKRPQEKRRSGVGKCFCLLVRAVSRRTCGA